MRLREFVHLNRAMLEAAIIEVVTGLEVGPKGEDAGFVCLPDNPIALLSAQVKLAAVKRLAAYGPLVALDHIMQFSFRIGASYGRRVPDITEPNLDAPMPTEERAANIVAMLRKECPPEVLRVILLELAVALRGSTVDPAIRYRHGAHPSMEPTRTEDQEPEDDSAATE